MSSNLRGWSWLRWAAYWVLSTSASYVLLWLVHLVMGKPRDFTSICTAETCGFRDMYDDLISRTTEVIGVSLDSNDSHRRFTEKYKLRFPLVSDGNKQLTRAYGALGTIRSILGIANRLTYVIDKTGTVAGVFQGSLAEPHIRGVREMLGKLK